MKLSGRRAVSGEHTHEFDEYMIVVKGRCTLILDGGRVALGAGDKFVIPRGKPHSGEVTAGRRTIHALGGRRAKRRLDSARL